MNITVSTIAVVLAALILAPAAQADPTDDANYLEELSMLGMNPGNLHRASLQVQIDLGHAICLDLGGGGRQSPNDMVTAMSRSLPNLSQHQIQMVISTAV